MTNYEITKQTTKSGRECVAIKFDAKPDAATRDALKAARFWWYGAAGTWCGFTTEEAARAILEGGAGSAAPVKAGKVVAVKAGPCTVETMKAGDIVRISGAFFKNANGLYLVEHCPGDPNWSGRDVCLHRINRDGTLSAANYSTQFWPLTHYLNDRRKAAEAREWDKAHAVIEFAAVDDLQGAKEHFEDEAEKAANYAEHMRRQGWNDEEARKMDEIAAFYKNVADGLQGSGKRPEVPEKVQKLAGDLKKALKAGKDAEDANPEDGGTCNLDACALDLPRWREKDIEKAAELAGTGVFKWFGSHWVFCPVSGGQGNARARNAEAMTSAMKSAGYEAFCYCQMD